ncbi:MAG: PIN domain-containing protein, partial [Methanoregula sp.]|nr:PIN domain-containing protein [Methanoregula sp.]
METDGDSGVRIVPDTSVIIDGRISKKVRSGEYAGAYVFVPEAVVSELEAQANRGFEIGQKGLDELLELRTLSDEGAITLSFVGEQPSLEQVKLARSGGIDALIRAQAMELDAVFVTGDRVQAQIATSKGLKVEWISPEKEEFG